VSLALLLAAILADRLGDRFDGDPDGPGDPRDLDELCRLLLTIVK